MTVSTANSEALDRSRSELHLAYLERELRRVRLLVERRILWLRRHWDREPGQRLPGLLISDRDADSLLAGEDRGARTRFFEEDPAAAPLSQALRALEEDCTGQRQSLAQAGSSHPLDLTATLFGLSDFERDVLLLCWAPELDSAFESLYAYLQDDATRRFLTPRLALSLLADLHGPPHELRSSFQPNAPLRRFCLLNLDNGAPPATPSAACPLSLDERMADFLRGVNRLDPRLSGLLKLPLVEPLPESHHHLAQQLAGPMRGGSSSSPWSAVNLIGPPDAGKPGVARAVCDLVGITLFELDLWRLPPAGPARQDWLRLLERDAILLQFALYLEAPLQETPPPELTLALNELLDRSNVFLFLASPRRWLTRRRMLPVEILKPNTGAQTRLWREALGAENSDRESTLAEIAQQFDFGPGAITEAAAAALQCAHLRQPGMPRPTDKELWLACREQAGWRLDELAQRIRSSYTWEHMVLPEDIFRQLREIAAQVSCRGKVYESWGFDLHLDRGRGLSVLFAGVSGTGKTMAAEILANHLGLDLFRIDLAGVVSKYIGETEKNLRQVFNAAEQSGAILFFDEADALFGKRSEVKDSHDRYANIEVDYLLQRMEAYRGIAILATNRKTSLDRAFLRRLRFLVDFPFPDSGSRRRIWEKIFPAQTPLDGLDFAALARLEITGGNIRNIALNAAFLAAAADKPVSMDHILHAARREYGKIEKLITEAEFGTYIKRLRG